MALKSTQPLTEISTSNLAGGKGRSVLKAVNLTVVCEPIVKKMWKHQRLKTVWTPGPFTGLSLSNLFTIEITLKTITGFASFTTNEEKHE
jgi:hypothetical protein